MHTACIRTVLILGLGESGRAMARWALRCGWALRLADTRPTLPSPLPPILMPWPSHLGPLKPSLLDEIDAVLISPGVDPRLPFVQAAKAFGIPVWGECTLFARALAQEASSPIILAITGTNGKTTCTALAHALVCAQGHDAVAAGNISPAMLDVVCDRLEARQALPAVWVLELSSFQLEAAEGFCAHAGLVLNLSQDHLDRYDCLEDYAKAKARLLAQSRVQVLNRDDPAVLAMALPDKPVFSFGMADPTQAALDAKGAATTANASNTLAALPAHTAFSLGFHAGERWLYRDTTALLPASALRLWGQHNALNALAVLALIEASGLCRADEATVLQALSAFGGLAHRVQTVARRRDGLVFVDDSKGTNVGATLAALEGLSVPVVLIAGGEGKGQDFAPLAPAVARHARAVIVLGKDAAILSLALSGTGVPLHRVASMTEAVTMANTLALQGDAILLSPACASLDMFSSYKARGAAFAKAACALPHVQPVESATP